MEMTTQQMIEAATKASEADKYGIGDCTEGRFHVYMVNVADAQRITRAGKHLRAMFYLQDAAGHYKRVSRAVFEAAKENA